MPAPTPNGPTLNDLLYGGYNQSGYQNVSTLIGALFISVSDLSLTKESQVFDADFTGNINFADWLNTAENVQVVEDQTGPHNFNISLGQTHSTTEAVTVTAPFNPSNTRVIVQSDVATTLDQSGVSSPA
jgi:hypothetical protein